MKFLFLMLLLACSSPKMQKQEALAEEAWKEHRLDEVLNHSFFSTLRKQKLVHEDSSETWVFQDQTKFQTSAYCDSLGGCMGMPVYNCLYAFSVKNNIISGMSSKGTCRQSKIILPE